MILFVFEVNCEQIKKEKNETNSETLDKKKYHITNFLK